MSFTGIQGTIQAIIGEREAGDQERYFMTITTFVSGFFSLLLCFFHLAMDLNLAPVFIASGSSLVLFGIYYLVRYTSHQTLAKVLLTLFGLLFLDLTWYTKYLSLGPLLFFILIFGALVIWVWEGKWLAIMLAYYFINVVVLFWMEYTRPDFMLEYVDLKARSVDIYLSFFFYSSLLIFLLSIVKKEFKYERDKALASDKLKSAFLANMSHEIRTPMNAIIGFSELLNDVDNDEDKKRYISLIQDSSSNLLRLINELIDLSKIEAGDVSLQLSEFKVMDLFDELLEVCQLDLDRRGKTDVTVNYVLEDKEERVTSDFMRMRQILSNLLSNAVKFTAHGSIEISFKREGQYDIYGVKDTGVGIPLKHQKEVFGRFVNFNYLGMNSEGTGIGLSIVERAVTLLGGEIVLESEEGVGTSFFVRIPCIK